jgi:hypothetical protein
VGAPESTSDNWRTEPWESDHTLRPVPANHFNLVEEQAQVTAEAIEAWLVTIEQGSSDDRAS